MQLQLLDRLEATGGETTQWHDNVHLHHLLHLRSIVVKKQLQLDTAFTISMASVDHYEQFSLWSRSDSESSLRPVRTRRRLIMETVREREKGRDKERERERENSVVQQVTNRFKNLGNLRRFYFVWFAFIPCFVLHFRVLHGRESNISGG